MSLLVLCPSRGRPEQAATVLKTFKKTKQLSDTRILFIVDNDDETAKSYPAKLTLKVEPTGCMGKAMQIALADPDVLRDATVVGFIGDDHFFRTPGWDRVFETWLTFHIGIAYPDDGLQHERLPTSWWLSRSIVDVFGMAHPDLRHLYMDNYWQSLGEGAKCIWYFPDVFIEHMHPLAGKSETDAIYERGNSNSNIEHDRSVFQRWEASSRKQDVTRLRSLIGYREPTVNVLADYHHPALYESLELLFGRFGWRLFRPIGLKWKTEDYWSFDNKDMNLDANDYLAVDQPHRAQDGYFELDNPQYPERPFKGVTLQQARAMDWGYVVASVWQNQKGFFRFAREQDAVFVHQIGNAKHNIDKTLTARYLLSAVRDENDLMSVSYHQEFDTDLFRYEPPGDVKRISNFVLRFDWTKEPHLLFEQARALMPDIEWNDYGSLYGEIQLQRNVADAMRAASFIWHDKPMGDGYGHALHNAAAVGRPLIGHASYYKGRLGEVFWRDLETCIDLDRHDLVETMLLIREILNDKPRHLAMCEAMAKTFRDNVDFDKEARRVKDLLEGRLDGDFYDAAYFTSGTKSSYGPYGPGSWAKSLAEMTKQYLSPSSVLDAGAAYGYVVAQLKQMGIEASGFDISPFAVQMRATDDIWLGSVEDPASYRPVDLILGTELAEHLIPEQALEFFRVAKDFGQRMLLLICIDLDPTADGLKSGFDPNDLSHVNVRPMWWWEDLVKQSGWKLGDASRFNTDARSREMNWAGRFILLER